ncbi:MAG: DEAD/DEAH box helicase family protein, partial [Bacteroides sp.]
KGCNNGEGNPVNPHGHKTAYLWEEILTKESLANLVQHFIRFDGKDKDPLDKRTLFFPRYHQLDVVRKMMADVQHRGAGQTYLIQHSAGSGKSNSITWAAFQLIDATPLSEDAAKAKGWDVPIFDSVIVVTDRRLLDKQIRDNIHNFTEVKNIVAHAESANELRKHIESGKRIIITTIQKFPFMVAEVDDMSDRQFAVLIDEAHSSQSGAAADAMNRAMGQVERSDEAVSAMETLQQLMQARKMCDNASYFAFTATPKRSTLERFGVKQPDGKFRPFHLYSMKQAIQEGFILDVLANYTTYKSYYKIQKSIEDNPLFNNKKAQKKLKKAVEMNPTTINMK